METTTNNKYPIEKQGNSRPRLKRLKNRVAGQNLERIGPLEDIYKAAFESSNDIVVLIDNNGDIIEVNEKLKEVSGYDRDELLGKNLRLLSGTITPANMTKILGNCSRGHACGYEPPYQVEIIKKNGELIVLEINVRTLKKDGKIAGDLAILRDITAQKNSERKLKESEKRFRMLAENAEYIIVHYSLLPRPHFEYVSPVVTVITGYSPEEFYTDPQLFFKIVHPDDRLAMDSQIQEAINDKKAITIRWFNKNGKVIWLEQQYHQNYDAAGNLVAIEGIIRDVTEREIAKNALQEREIKFKQIFDNIRSCVVVYEALENGQNFIIKEFNKAAETLEKINRTEVTGRLVTDVFPGIKDFGLFKILQQVYKTGKPDYHPGTLYKDNRINSWRENYVYKLPTGEIVVCYEDVTERKQAEERIKQAAEEWRRTFDSINDMVCILDKEYRLLRVNKAYADAFGKKPKELLGLHCYELVHGTHEHHWYCPNQKTFKTGKIAREEFFEQHLGIFLEITTSPIFNDAGEVTGTVHVTRDVSERKQIEQQLMLTDRLASIGELASGIAHELNNPLTSVIGFSQLLKEREIPEDMKEDLDLINSEAQRAAGIVKNLLTFARKHAPVKQLVRINEVIETILKIRAYEQKVHSITVNRQLATDLPEVMADYFQMQQVFMNLIINAEFFMTEAHNKGSLTITTKSTGKTIRISFTDDGPGISAENLRKLFNPFFTTKEVGKGTGLGLSICHGIVTEHGGEIYARSESGKGATFIVELPMDGHRNTEGKNDTN